MRIHSTSLKFSLITLTLCVMYSCKGDVGDECVADAQCGTGQTCDLISDGGYCTIKDCREDECPEGSICVTFENDDRYCMATCNSSGDCRDGYSCDQDLESEAFCRQNAD